MVRGPEAVWAHMKPVLMDIKKENPNVTKLENLSDGPVTQYRQKGNFYLACTKGKELGFDNIKWSFFEAGHGKGIPDAIGCAVKRRADTASKYGQDITSVEKFCNIVSQGSSVKIFQRK